MAFKKLLALPLLLSLTACAGVLPGSSPSDQATPRSEPAQEEQTRFYYDFDDILVPKEMELTPKNSLLLETPQVKAGVIQFKGRVEPISLFDFFQTNMPKDGWQLRSYIKYGRYLMVYEKPDRDCVISIDESSLTTSMEIWVTPRINGTGASTFSPQLERNLAQ
ncbi:MAG TPA: hypothetical protein VJ934_10675 [Desulfomicrobiaceae bacterium]|nr:hypothetical protein [Desulfomicrobiaceae bacterium]